MKKILSFTKFSTPEQVMNMVKTKKKIAFCFMLRENIFDNVIFAMRYIASYELDSSKYLIAVKFNDRKKVKWLITTPDEAAKDIAA